jgi:signal transduction histidine kinase
MILLPLTVHSVVLLPELWRYGMNALMALSYVATLRWLTGSWDAVIANLPVFLAGQVFVLVFTQMALTEVKSRKEIQQLADELGDANIQLRKYAAQVEMLAVEKERNRLAREIHDGVGHHLTAANMQVKAARAVLTTDIQRTDKLLENAEHLTQRALLDIRQSVSTLRENQVDGKNLVAQIERVIANAENGGLAVSFNVNGEPRAILPEAYLTIFRAVQESASNTLKHAHAKHMVVVLDYENPNHFRLLIRDDGIGSDAYDGGYGLLGMRERVNLLNGSLRITTAKGHGFEIEIVIPEKL